MTSDDERGPRPSRANTNDAFERDIGFMVAKKRCDECLFSKNKIVSDDRRREVLTDCKRTGKYFLCHKATIAGGAVVCRGYYDEGSNPACQIAGRLGLTVFVDPADPPIRKRAKRTKRAAKVRAQKKTTDRSKDPSAE